MKSKNIKNTVFKLLCIMLVCTCPIFISACNQTKDIAESIDLSEVVKANNTDNLLNYYNSFRISADYGDENSQYNSESYIDQEVYYYEQGDTYREIVGDDLLFVYEDGVYSGRLLADGGEYELVLENMLLDESTSEETVTEAVDDGQNIRLKTRSQGDTDYIKTFLEELGKEYADGDFIQNEYTLNSANYALTEIKTKSIHEDGSEDLLAELKVTYDEPRPDIVQEMLERSIPETDLRTLTVVLDPNTDKEKVYSRKVQKGYLFGVTVPEGYKLYKDEACTVLYNEETDTNAHVLVYAKADGADKEK